MSEIYKQYERNKLQITILYDESPPNPREYDCNIGVMICSHRKCNLGDEQFNPNDFQSFEDLKRHLINDRKAVIVLPLNLYDHSGITMSINDSAIFDSSQVGFIYCTQKQIDDEFNGDRDKAYNALVSEVSEYDKYLTGDVYGVRVTDPRNGEILDECWGLFGVDYALDQANSIADNFVHPRESKYAKKAGQLHG